MRKFLRIAMMLSGILAMSFTACQTDGSREVLRLSTNALKFDHTASQQYVEVSGAEWSASVNQSWVTVDPQSGSDGTITVSVEANETGTTRFASITVSNAVDSQVVSIEQGFLGEATLTPTAIDFTAAGDMKIIAVDSPSDWEVSSSNPEWLTVNKVSEIEFTATAVANNGDLRHAVITVTNEAGEKTVAVSQEEYRVVLTYSWGTYYPYYNDDSIGQFMLQLMAFHEDDQSPVGYAITMSLFSLKPDMTQMNLNLAPGSYVLSNTMGVSHNVYMPYMSVDYYDENSSRTSPTVTGGTLTVEGNSVEGYIIKMDFELAGGETIRLKFDGDIYISNVYITPPASTFTDNQIIGDVPIVSLTYWPDALGDGAADAFMLRGHTSGLRIEMEGDNEVYKGTGWTFGSQIATPLNGGNIMEGEFDIAMSTSAGYALSGYLSGNQQMIGTWARRIDNDEVTGRGPLVSGTVTSEYNEGVYTIDVYGLDDAGYTINVTLEGEIEATTMSASRSLPARRPASGVSTMGAVPARAL